MRTPGTRAYVTNAPRVFRQPLPGYVSLFPFYPGVRFAHPRLSSFRPAGAELGTAEAVPLRPLTMGWIRPLAMNECKFDHFVNFVCT